MNVCAPYVSILIFFHSGQGSVHGLGFGQPPVTGSAGLFVPQLPAHPLHPGVGRGPGQRKVRTAADNISYTL